MQAVVPSLHCIFESVPFIFLFILLSCKSKIYYLLYQSIIAYVKRVNKRDSRFWCWCCWWEMKMKGEGKVWEQHSPFRLSQFSSSSSSSPHDFDGYTCNIKYLANQEQLEVSCVAFPSICSLPSREEKFWNLIKWIPCLLTVHSCINAECAVCADGKKATKDEKASQRKLRALERYYEDEDQFVILKLCF